MNETFRFNRTTIRFEGKDVPLVWGGPVRGRNGFVTKHIARKSVFFSNGARGIHERGYWDFWVAVSNVVYYEENLRKLRSIVMRWPTDRNPTGRLRYARGNENQFEHIRVVLDSLSFVRPAVDHEVKYWMDTHPSDSPYAVM